MPYKIARNVLNTDFALFQSSEKKDVTLARITKPYYLPKEIADVVELVDDILRFPSVHRSLRKVYKHATMKESSVAAISPFNSCGADCTGFTTPAVLRDAYKIETITNVAKGNSMAVVDFSTNIIIMLILVNLILCVMNMLQYQKLTVEIYHRTVVFILIYVLRLF